MTANSLWWIFQENENNQHHTTYRDTASSVAPVPHSEQCSVLGPPAKHLETKSDGEHFESESENLTIWFYEYIVYYDHDYY